jgi:hypothetical protein
VGDLSVVGLDLRTGRSVHVEDQPKHVWKIKGYNGDATLVCWHCYHGIDMPAGTRVPLLYRGGKQYGKVRAHFAHPAGLGPPNGHHPETIWHANAKQTMLNWALRQAGVTDARTEYWTADGRRRSDVSVMFADGTRLAIEVQQQPVTDEEWTARHQDYAGAGIVDVWLWHPRIGVPGIVLAEPQCHWMLSADLERIGIPLASPHRRIGPWWQRPDQWPYAVHYPPCPGDKIRPQWVDLPSVAIDPGGIVLPASIRDELQEHTARAERLAEAYRRHHEDRRRGWANPPPPLPLTDPSGEIAAEAVECHEVHRIDALPPHAEPSLRRYRCRICNWVPPEALTDGVHKLIEYP